MATHTCQRTISSIYPPTNTPINPQQQDEPQQPNQPTPQHNPQHITGTQKKTPDQPAKQERTQLNSSNILSPCPQRPTPNNNQHIKGAKQKTDPPRNREKKPKKQIFFI